MSTSHRGEPDVDLRTASAHEPEPRAKIAPTLPRARPPLPALVLTVATICWIVVYAGIRAALIVMDPPVPLSPVGDDLVVLAGWPGVVALGVAAMIITLQATTAKGERPIAAIRWGLVVAGTVSAAALCVAAALLLLDLVGGVLPGIGVPFHPYGAASRLGCILAASLIAAHTRQFWMRTRPAPRRLGLLTETPRWVILAGYLAAIGCLVRLGAQLVVGLDVNPLAAGPTFVVFEVGFLLAGLLLPLALVHRWGRIWPFWVPLLAGRPVPRWLMIISGGTLGVGMTSYFGMMLAQMVAERLQGRNPFPPAGGLDLPEPFFWVSIPGYLVWGLGLLVATANYIRLTKTGGRS